MTVRQLEAGTYEVQNQYPRVVQKEGNRVAQNLVNEVFEVCDRKWRGVGSIPKSGYKLRYEFRDHDADRIFDTKEIDTKEPEICISGLVLKGVKKPHDVRRLETSAPPSIRSARPWFPQKAPVPRITLTAGIWRKRKLQSLHHD